MVGDRDQLLSSCRQFCSLLPLGIIGVRITLIRGWASLQVREVCISVLVDFIIFFPTYKEKPMIFMKFQSLFYLQSPLNLIWLFLLF